MLAGYDGVFGGNNGLNDDEDGTLLVGSRVAGCLVGEVGREGRLEIPVTKGGRDFWGLGEGGILLFACGYARFRQVYRKKQILTVVGSLLDVSRRDLWAFPWPRTGSGFLGDVAGIIRAIEVGKA